MTGHSALRWISISLIFIAIPTKGADSSNQNSCWNSFSQLLSPSVSLEKLKSWTRKLTAEIIDTRGKRIFIKKRTQGQKLRGLAGLNAFLMNPIASTFDRPTQGTWITTALGYTLFVDFTALKLDTLNKEHDIEEAKKLLIQNQIPGAPYIWDLIQSGFLDPAQGAAAILGHEETLRDWSQQAPPRSSPLPRVLDFLEAKLIDRSEIPRLDTLMKEVLKSTTEKIKNSDAFTIHLFENFKNALRKDPHFKLKNKGQIELLSTAFWPRARGSQLSDIALGTLLQTQPYQEILRLLDKNLISVGEAYQMAQSKLDDPGLIEKKKAQSAKLFSPKALPQGTSSPADRPDIPRFSKPIRWGQSLLTGELSRWEILWSDPRFAPLKKNWLSGQISELALLTALEASLTGLQSLIEADQAAEKFSLSDQSVGDLFGFPNTPANPLFTKSKEELLLVAAQKNLAPEQVFECMKELAEFWRSYHLSEARDVREGISSEALIQKRQSLLSQRNEQYQEIFNRCQRASRAAPPG